MNRYEKRAEQERKSALRLSMMFWLTALALLVVVLAIWGLSGAASPRFSSRGAIVLAILLLLILRQVSRRLRGKNPRAAQPDPRSTLKLD